MCQVLLYRIIFCILLPRHKHYCCFLSLKTSCGFCPNRQCLFHQAILLPPNFIYTTQIQKKLLHLSYIRTVRYAVRNNVNSFCLRLILSDVYPWYLFSTTVTAELCRRSTAYRSHGRLTRSISPHLEVSLSSHVSSPTLKAIQRSERHSYRSLVWGLGVWFMRLPRFHTSRVINVLAELIFNFQDA